MKAKILVYALATLIVTTIHLVEAQPHIGMLSNGPPFCDLGPPRCVPSKVA